MAKLNTTVENIQLKSNMVIAGDSEIDWASDSKYPSAKAVLEKLDTFSTGFDFPVGSILVTATNENPAAKVGGAWELIDKVYNNDKLHLNAGASSWTAKSASLTSGVIIKADHTSRVSLTLTTTISLSSSSSASDLKLGTISPAVVGAGEIPYIAFGVSDLVNGIVQAINKEGTETYDIQYNIDASGSITLTKIFNNKTLPVGTVINLIAYIPMHKDFMSDSACDKFYWKRLTTQQSTSTPVGYIRGDVDGTGEVDTNDSIYLLRHTLLPNDYLLNQNGDMNGDGKVDSDDAIYLLRHVLFPDKYSLYDGETVVPPSLNAPEYNEAYKLTIDSKTAQIGDNVTVDFYFADDYTANAISFDAFYYDHSVLELIGGSWTGASKTVIKQVNIEDAFALLAFDEATSTKGLKLSLTFKVSNSAVVGDYTIDCDTIISTNTGETFKAVVNTGTITIATPELCYEGTCGNNLTWRLNAASGELTINGTGIMDSYLTAYPAPWASYPDLLTSVTIGDGVTSIGNYAFSGCSSLKSVTIGNSVTSIGSYAFAWCSSLTSVTIPDSVTSIGDYAFNECYDLTSVTLGNNLSTIGSAAFLYCTNLTGITLPDSVNVIGSCAFGDTSIAFNTYDNARYLGNTNNPYMYLWATEDFGAGIHEDTKIIGDGAFTNDDTITNIIIPSNVVSISDGAFWACDNLVSITIPDSVRYIGEQAFCGCKQLANIIVDTNNKKYISAGNCLIDKTTKNLMVGCINSVIPTDGSVDEIGRHAFSYSQISTITIPDSITRISSNAFNNCTNLVSIVIPSNVTSIGDSAFWNCSSLTSVTIQGNKVDYIADNAFRYCNQLTNIYCAFAEGSVSTRAPWGAPNATIHYNS